MTIQTPYRLGTNQNLSSTASSTPTIAFSSATTRIRLVATAAVNYRIGAVALGPFTVNAATWAATSGGQATFTTTAPHGIGVGSVVTITGVIPTGQNTGNNTGYNGTYTTITGTTGSTIVVALATNPGTYVSGGAASGSGPPTAVAATDPLLPANTLEQILVSPGQYLASIGTATVSVTELS